MLKNKEQRRLSAIMQNATDVIITFREDGQIIFCNPAIEPAFGYAAEDVIGQPLAMLIAENIDEQLDSFSQLNVPSTLKNSHLIRNKTVGQRKDGSSIPIDFSVSRIDLDTESLFLGVICVNTIAAKRSNVLQRAREDTRTATLTDTGKLKTINHSFHTPLNRIVNSAALLQQTALTDEQDDTVRLIHDSGHAMLSLLNDVLNSSNTKVEEEETAVSSRQQDETWPIDMARVNKMFGTEYIGLLEELVELFLEDSPPIFEKIQQALIVFDRDIIRHGVHTLKGSSGSIGISTLAASFADLEKLAATGSKDEIETAVNFVYAEYQTIADVLSEN